MGNSHVCRLVAAGLLLAPFSAAWPQSADDRLGAFFKTYLEHYLAERPFEATRLGDHRFDHLLEDLSPATRAAWLENTRQTLAELPRQVDYAALSRPAQIDFEILRHELAKTIWLVENTPRFETDPRVYNEYLTDSVFLLLTQSTLPKETNIAHALARMELLPRIVAAARANLQNPPRQFVETAVRQNQGAIAFYRKDLFDLVGKTPQLGALQTAAHKVAVALEEYQQFLKEDLLPRANGDWRLGRDRFAQKLDLELDAGRTADEVLADARQEFERVQRDMYVIARQLWSRYFPRQALPPDDEAGRRATVQEVLSRVSLEHSTAQTVVRDARAAVTEIKRFIRERDIVRLPEPDHCQIIEMPEFQRGNSTAFMNSAPPLDPRASGYYAVSPPPKDWSAAKVESYFREYNRHMLRVLSLHEGYPGHYVQLEYANRNPSLIRKVLPSGVFIEGWAVYTEQMMLDQGFGGGDLALRLNQLKFYLRAVANTILDHDMHCTGLTDDEAYRFLTEQAYQSEGEARLKIIRAKQSSCQLSTYFVGRMAIYRLHQTLERELGSAFDLGRFHEAVLDPGAVPVKYLPELVRARPQRPR